ncbi:DUF29 domain-containing protein [Synechocystis sp. LEGE 06083]|uniref:DUF29 domain-containing protein n=1 Tax=Synechocystis sp. LEGE 06083 TaxID=915336 RepID=UPI00187E6A3C|nr:DUF29 domain-containing protein [Synechocystis sp. LEGE 06083]MBE9197268.1 DUF29 domain-containing protein [Synechocystis sp. LEGE 06083]
MEQQTTTLYDTDFNLWIEQTVHQLKQGDLQSLDVENLIEEIESMGRSDKREVYSRLKVLFLHLLKWKYQTQKRTGSWKNTIDEQRDQLNLILADSPSLNPYLQAIFADCYLKGRKGAVNETNLPLSNFPVDCPFSLAEILDAEFLPD